MVQLGGIFGGTGLPFTQTTAAQRAAILGLPLEGGPVIGGTFVPANSRGLSPGSLVSTVNEGGRDSSPGGPTGISGPVGVSDPTDLSFESVSESVQSAVDEIGSTISGINSPEDVANFAVEAFNSFSGREIGGFVGNVASAGLGLGKANPLGLIGSVAGTAISQSLAETGLEKAGLTSKQAEISGLEAFFSPLFGARDVAEQSAEIGAKSGLDIGEATKGDVAAKGGGKLDVNVDPFGTFTGPLSPFGGKNASFETAVAAFDAIQAEAAPQAALESTIGLEAFGGIGPATLGNEPFAEPATPENVANAAFAVSADFGDLSGFGFPGSPEEAAAVAAGIGSLEVGPFGGLGFTGPFDPSDFLGIEGAGPGSRGGITGQESQSGFNFGNDAEDDPGVLGPGDFGPFGTEFAGFEGIESLLGGADDDTGSGDAGSGSGDDSGDAGAGDCFVGGTPILMADGSHKPIEFIEIGDDVMSFLGSRQDGWASELEPNKVINVKVGTEPIIMLNGIGVSPLEWVVLANGSVSRVRDISIGMFILDENGEEQRVWGAARQSRMQTVFNFDVENAHSYIAGGIRTVRGMGVRGYNLNPASPYPTMQEALNQYLKKAA